MLPGRRLSPWGQAPSGLPYTSRRSRTINGQAITIRSSKRTSAAQGLEGFHVAVCPSITDAKTCCANPPSMAENPMRVQIRAVPPP